MKINNSNFILEKGKTPKGTPIQLENWNNQYSFKPYGSIIGTYPIAQATGEGQFSPKKGKPFRLTIEFNSHEETQEAFKNLTEGNKTIVDYKNNFYDPWVIEYL